jgi:hypothetical protein
MYLTGRRSVASLTMAGFVAALALAGCSEGGGDSTSAAGGAAQGNRAPAEAPANQAPAQAQQDKANAAPGNPPAAEAQQGGQQDKSAAQAGYRLEERAIIFTGSITVRVHDVEAAATRATAIATAAGGFVGADKRSSNDKRSEATIQLRVPAGRFGTALDDVAKLGRQESRDVNTEDVTEEVIDLDAKIASQQASVARTRALFAQAKTISEISSVESELAKRESELATLQARKRRLDDLTTLSTITATLLGPEAPAPQAVAEKKDEAGFVAGLKTGWHGFLSVITVVLVVLGFLLPFVIVAGIPIGITWWMLRARRRREATAAPTAAAPAPAPPAS